MQQHQHAVQLLSPAGMTAAHLLPDDLPHLAAALGLGQLRLEVRLLVGAEDAAVGILRAKCSCVLEAGAQSYTTLPEGARCCLHAGCWQSSDQAEQTAHASHAQMGSGTRVSQQTAVTHGACGVVLLVAADDAGVQHDELHELAELEAAEDLRVCGTASELEAACTSGTQSQQAAAPCQLIDPTRWCRHTGAEPQHDTCSLLSGLPWRMGSAS
jgi:hypothetical protein